MQKAFQAALAQSTNIELLNIRNIEISYFTTYCISIGIQAAFIGGFCYSGLTQIGIANIDLPNGYDSSGFSVTTNVYYVVSAVSILAGLHCLVTTAFLSVLGPGYSLYGPRGSVVKTANWMRQELDPIFYVFIVMVIGFAITVVASAWLLMSTSSATICTGVFLVFSLFWWRSCQRIATRFHINPQRNPYRDFDNKLKQFSKLSAVVEGDEGEEGLSGISGVNAQDCLDAAADYHLMEDPPDPPQPTRRPSSNNTPNKMSGSGIKTPRPSVFSRFGRRGSKSEWWSRWRQQGTLHEEDSDARSDTSGGLHQRTPSEGSAMDGGEASSSRASSTAASVYNDPSLFLFTRGYLTFNERRNSWIRRFFAIMKQTHLHYYASQSAFRQRPGHPLNSRPIDLAEYIVSVPPEPSNSPRSGKAREGSVEAFRIVLEPKPTETTGISKSKSKDSSARRTWILLCDTEEERDGWLASLTNAAAVASGGRPDS